MVGSRTGIGAESTRGLGEQERQRGSDWMRKERGIDENAISACLAAHYGLDVASITFLPVGNDFQAAVYRVATTDGADYFLKVRFGPVYEPGLLVPRALVDLGIANVLAPLRTNSSALWCPLDA